MTDARAKPHEPMRNKMAQWMCGPCGWVYDEAVGLPDEGIAAGTRFEDIPADWVCPDCGVGKADFYELPD